MPAAPFLIASALPRRRTAALLLAAAGVAAAGFAAAGAAAQDTAPPAQAPVPQAVIASPDGSIVVRVETDRDGRARYSVTRRGELIVAPSGLGFLFTDQPKIERNLRVAAVTTGRSDTSWEQPWGEWRRIRDHHTEMRVRLEETNRLRRHLDVVFRVQDDGVGFRYEVPDQANLHGANIADELTEFNIAAEGTAWWKPAFRWNREEYLYERTPIGATGTAATPITMKLGSGTHVTIHEAALVDYAGMNLRKSAGRQFAAVLTPGTRGPKVVKQGSWTTPWRTLLIADDAGGLYASHLMLNLNEPNRLGDVSWVKPGKFAGVWWNMITGKWSWGRGPIHGATTANVKAYIDFAAANNMQGVLVEGWNVGWDGDWFGNGNAMNFAQPTEDFDAGAIQRYAQAKGVYIIGHHETAGSASHYENQFDSAFRYAAQHGIPAVKTGYVTDAGQIERVDPDGTRSREWHEGQWMVGHYLRVVQAAARYRVAIDTHEPVKGTGLHRTWPNWIAREGSRGMEYMSWADKNPPEHEANLVFTRMLEGPMDFTPGILSLKGEGGSDIPSTLAKQLALYVVIYSPVVMAADTPETYARHPGPLKFIRDVPTDWEDTRVLNGEVGDFVTFARKVRGGRDWYIGSVTDEHARDLTIALDFLDAGRSYLAEIYRDGPGARYDTPARHAIAIESRRVKKGDHMLLSLAPGGGQAIRLKAL